MNNSRFCMLACMICLAAGGGRLVAFEDAGGGRLDDKGRFTYQDDERRDPFTIAAPADKSPPPPPPSPTEVSLRKARAYLSLARHAFMNAKPSQACTYCQKAIKILDKAKEGRRMFQLEDTRNKLLRLMTASGRLRTRRETEAAFRKLDLRLQGVVAQGKDGQAILNGRVVCKRDLIQVGNGAAVAIVEAIKPGGLLLRFQGFLMDLWVGETGAGR